MRAETNRTKLEAFMTVLGDRVRGDGCIYLDPATFRAAVKEFRAGPL